MSCGMVFPKGMPVREILSELKEAVRNHMRKRHARF